MRKIRKRIAFIAIGLLLCVIAIASVHRTVKVVFKGGGAAELKPASLLASIFGAKCVIAIESISGKKATIDLLQDRFNGPLTVVATTNENIFLCIYNYDVDIQILRIDLTQKFHTLQTGDFLLGTVLESTCKVDRVKRGDSNDWNTAVAGLKQMTSKEYKQEATGLDLGLFRIQTNQGRLLASLRNFGDQGIYPDDSVVSLSSK
jgi:hypothetical protein